MQAIYSQFYWMMTIWWFCGLSVVTRQQCKPPPPSPPAILSDLFWLPTVFQYFILKESFTINRKKYLVGIVEAETKDKTYYSNLVVLGINSWGITSWFCASLALAEYCPCLAMLGPGTPAVHWHAVMQSTGKQPVPCQCCMLVRHWHGPYCTIFLASIS